MKMRPVVTSVSQATRPSGSSASTASRIASEIWSAILSGCRSGTTRSLPLPVPLRARGRAGILARMDPERLPPQDTALAAAGEAVELELLVRRSDEDVALFDSQRIVEALVREAHLDRERAR